jgi:hypothetical protein
MRVTRVAIKTADGVFSLPRPNRHHHILRFLFSQGPRDYNSEVEGFTDEYGNFLTRREAYEIAAKNGQIDRSWHPPNSYDGDKLFSEDLWKS